MGWNVKKPHLLQSLKSETIKIDDDIDDIDVNKFECDICRTSAFSNRYSLAAHKGHCQKKHNIKKQKSKKTNKNNKNIKKKQDEMIDIDKERGFTEFDFNELSKNEKAAFLKKQ